MPINDQANDRYNPPGNLSDDFEEFKFSELEVDELFWQTNQPGDNIPWRKVNQTQALNIKAQTTHNFNTSTIVWQKT
jgi:translation elongation factor EF-Tu-like GTPase